MASVVLSARARPSQWGAGSRGSLAFVNELARFLGLTDPAGSWYAFWSGIGSDLGELPLLGVLVLLYRRTECHADRCHRVGLHHVHGTQFVTCRRHHPTGGNTAEAITQAHDLAVKRP